VLVLDASPCAAAQPPGPIIADPLTGTEIEQTENASLRVPLCVDLRAADVALPPNPAH
jgi:hypothetical protein